MTERQELTTHGLKRLNKTADHAFFRPVKKINDGDDLDFWLTTTACRDLTRWLMQLNHAMFPRQFTPKAESSSHQTGPSTTSEDAIKKTKTIVQSLKGLIDEAPPKTGPRRFGNVAFRDWFELAEDRIPDLLRASFGTDVPEQAIEELSTYLIGGLGSSPRLDYGTGHELSFLAFLACLWELDVFADGQERAIVMEIVQSYLELIRTLILTYTLEPAGSHGVWGLDDHSFVPYIFGSAQFGPTINDNDDVIRPTPTEGSSPFSPSPSSVTKPELVRDYKDTNMYFSAIQFIYDVKKGPFWEHSPVLYDISGIKDGWAKINKGMLKMYAAEVLGKFPVVQHFPFGSLFRWEQDPDVAVARQEVSVHARQQPRTSKPPPNSSSIGMTDVPSTSSTRLQSQMNTGMPSTRAPWLNSGAIPLAPAISSTARTPAPWANATRAGQSSNPPPTMAPWARKDRP